MPKEDRQAKRLKHMSTGRNLYKSTKAKTKKVVRREGR
jgi:hypothetical protein